MQKNTFNLILTGLAVIIFLNWANVNNLISWVNIDGTITVYVNWKVLAFKLHESLAFGLLITVMLNWATPNWRS